jgi:PAS domain S-box-containing protein
MSLNPYFSSQELLESIFEHAVDGIVLINSWGIILQVNPAAARLFGYEAEELSGQNISLLMPEPDQTAHDGYLRNYHQTGRKKIIGIGREVNGLRKDGGIFPFKLSVSELWINNLRVYLGIIHDITEQKQAQQRTVKMNEELERRIAQRTEKLAEVVNKLLETNESLKQEIKERQEIEAQLLVQQEEVRKALEKERELSELKSRFVSMASHEFRTPLSTILSSIALVSRYETTEGQEQRLKHIQRIKSAVNNLTNILNDFLSLSKLEEGKVEHKPQNFDLELCVREVLEEMQVFAKLGQVFDYQHDHDQNLVYLDDRMFKNVMINLLSNAVKYSGENTRIEIRTQIRQGHLSLSVKDQGIGIPAEEQEMLFERFFRAKNVTNIQGTGLGLNIVKKYLDLMNGSIRFESTEGQGTTFFVEIPV